MKYELSGILKMAYRLQPMWYDQEFVGMEYEVRKLIEALDLIGGKVYGVWAKKDRRCTCGCAMHQEMVEVTDEFLPVKQATDAPLA